MEVKIEWMENQMKKLLALTILFSFGAADAGFFSSIKNKVKSVGSSIKNQVQNNKGAITNQLQGISGTVISSAASVADQRIAQKSIENNTMTNIIIADPTVTVELSNALNSMYSAVDIIRQSNATDPTILFYATSLGSTLKLCINNPSMTPANLSVIKENVSNLNNANLSQMLKILESAVTKFSNSSVSINSSATNTINVSKINATTYKEFLVAISNMRQEIAKIQSWYQGNSTLVTFSAQVDSVLQNCSQTLVLNSTHISAVNLYIQWVKNQSIDVTALNQRLTELNEKTTKFNDAVIAATYNVVLNSSNPSTAIPSTTGGGTTANIASAVVASASTANTTTATTSAATTPAVTVAMTSSTSTSGTTTTKKRR